MTVEQIKELIKQGEKVDVEFKESTFALPKNIYDTVCSFSNRNGGDILLGVNDKREIVGVDPNAINNIFKEFVTTVNNPEKIRPPLYIIPVTYAIDNKMVIHIKVPKGQQVCLHRGKIMDRSFEGDIDITYQGEQVRKLYTRKHEKFFTDKVYPKL